MTREIPPIRFMDVLYALLAAIIALLLVLTVIDGDGVDPWYDHHTGADY